jgi:hypothetical protein
VSSTCASHPNPTDPRETDAASHAMTDTDKDARQRAAAQGEALTACRAACVRIIDQYDGWPQCGIDFHALLKGIDAALASPVEALQAEQKDERTLRCANCGKHREQAEDCISDYPEEGEWFCSQACYDQHSDLGCPHGTHNGLPAPRRGGPPDRV